MVPSWAVRGFRDSDLPAVAELARLVHASGGGSAMLSNTAYLQWKYGRNPNGAVSVVVENGGQIVGFGGLVLCLVKIDSTTKRCANIGDYIVHPQFRRQGISLAMSRYLLRAMQDISMIYALAEDVKQPTAVAGVKYLDYKTAGEVVVLKKFLSPMSSIRHLWVYPRLTLANLLKYLGALVELISIVLKGNLTLLLNVRQNSLLSAAEEGKLMQVKEMDPEAFNEDFDRLWVEVNGSLPIALVRQKEYLRWRYTNPVVPCIVFRADRDRVLRGYSVQTYRVHGKLKLAWIVDILAADAQAGVELVKECVRRAKQDRADIMLMNRTKQGARLPFKRLGFQTAWGQKNHLFAHAYSADVSEAFVDNISNWYLTPADTGFTYGSHYNLLGYSYWLP
jgi:GNAT superfamily N-acetyltransferase